MPARSPTEHAFHHIMLTQALTNSLYNSWRFLFFELIAEWPRFPFWHIHPVITFRSCYLLGLGVGSLTYFPFDPLYTGWLKMVYPSQAKLTVIGAPHSHTSNSMNVHYCAAQKDGTKRWHKRGLSEGPQQNLILPLLLYQQHNDAQGKCKPLRSTNPGCCLKIPGFCPKGRCHFTASLPTSLTS